MASSIDPANFGKDRSKSDLSHFAEWFDHFGVEFIVIGGQAETLMGSPRVTFDVDLCYRRSPDNHKRLATALQTLDVKLRNVPPEVRFQLDARTLALGASFTTSLVDLDLLGWVEPIGDFDALVKKCENLSHRERERQSDRPRRPDHDQTPYQPVQGPRFAVSVARNQTHP